MSGHWHRGAPYYDDVLRRWIRTNEWVPYGDPPKEKEADAGPPPPAPDTEKQATVPEVSPTANTASESAVSESDFTADGNSGAAADSSAAVIGLDQAVDTLAAKSAEVSPVIQDTRTIAPDAEVTSAAGSSSESAPGPYTHVDGKWRCNGCGVEKDTEKAMKLHVPHCKGKER